MDPEQILKKLTLGEQDVVLTFREANLLLKRLKSYRQKINDIARKMHLKFSKDVARLHYLENLFYHAKMRIGTKVNNGDAAYHLGELFKLVGSHVGMRMFWGEKADDECQEALTEAVAYARERARLSHEEQNRWWNKRCQECRKS